MMTLTSYHATRHKHVDPTFPFDGTDIYKAFQKEGYPVKWLRGTTAFTLGGVVIQAPHKEVTCISLSKDKAELAYVKTILRGVRHRMATQKKLADLAAKRAEEKRSKFDIQAFLRRRRNPKQDPPNDRVPLLDGIQDVYTNASKARLEFELAIEKLHIQQQELEEDVPEIWRTEDDIREEQLLEKVRTAWQERKQQAETRLANPELVKASDAAFEDFREDMIKLSRPHAKVEAWLDGCDKDLEAGLSLEQQGWPTEPYRPASPLAVHAHDSKFSSQEQLVKEVV
ncbi:hypothetical protein HII31_00535 [Pseudocercospora fuligena]|uniref:Uncharacterized protein n=1 Tax=Pseudocercospora fuligena TaxID=685502 RepID=A0A8H6VRS4_9PEZI|nr:hypothetical protein HII31_00535 [Pseudocercospora fuligena]